MGTSSSFFVIDFSFNFIVVWQQHCMTSILLNSLTFVLWPITWFILVSIHNVLKYISFYRTLHSITAEYTFSLPPRTHRTFTKIDHVVGYKIDIKFFKKIKIVQGLSLSTTIKLEIKNRNKSLNTWKLYNTLLNNLWIKGEVSKKNLKIYINWIKIKICNMQLKHCRERNL